MVSYGTHRDSTVEAGAARNEQQTTTASDFRHVVLNAAQSHLVGVEENATSHCVHGRLRLLEDLLLHEPAVVACKVRRGACCSAVYSRT